MIAATASTASQAGHHSHNTINHGRARCVNATTRCGLPTEPHQQYAAPSCASYAYHHTYHRQSCARIFLARHHTAVRVSVGSRIGVGRKQKCDDSMTVEETHKTRSAQKAARCQRSRPFVLHDGCRRLEHAVRGACSGPAQPVVSVSAPPGVHTGPGKADAGRSCAHQPAAPCYSPQPSPCRGCSACHATHTAWDRHSTVLHD